MMRRREFITLEAYGLFCFASGKLYDNHTHWRERFRWLYLEG
jgi:hypothetical protein